MLFTPDFMIHRLIANTFDAIDEDTASLSRNSGLHYVAISAMHG